MKSEMESDAIFDEMDYMSAAPNSFVEDEIFYDLSNKELVSLRKIIDRNFYQDSYGKTFSVNVCDRYAVVHIPNNLIEPMPLLLFYHGLGDHPWHMAINGTNWRVLADKYKFILVFAAGTNCGAVHDRRCGFNIKNPKTDFCYTKQLLDIIKKMYNIDNTKIYTVGYSNGAIFSSILAQKYGSKLFKSMVNIMGGFGYEHSEVSDIGIVNPLPILFVTGTDDPYSDGCTYAHDFFLTKDYDSSVKILPDHDHTYPIDEETHIWAYLVGQ